MKTGPKLPLSQRRGGSAEDEIKGRLKYFSIPAKPELDIGLDLCCELLDGNKPTGKFFGVQAKGTRKLDHLRWSIKRTTLEYWLMQSFPVFLIVYDETDDNCYWTSIVQDLQEIVKRIKPNSKTVSIIIDKAHVLGKCGLQKDEFVKEVKNATFLINLLRGRPQLEGSYVRKSAPLAILSNGVILNLKENIRTSLNFLINHYICTNKFETALFLCDFLTRFDTAHYDHFFKMGQIYRILGKKEEARKYFTKAIQKCKEDPNWNRLKKPSDPSIEDIIKMIENEMKRL
jgi:tetratricopeptide (TPR) repeat protein